MHAPIKTRQTEDQDARLNDTARPTEFEKPSPVKAFSTSIADKSPLPSLSKAAKSVCASASNAVTRAEACESETIAAAPCAPAHDSHEKAVCFGHGSSPSATTSAAGCSSKAVLFRKGATLLRIVASESGAPRHRQPSR